MAEEIVPCPSCAKKFRIPDGAPPGSFPCTACDASVAYGAAAGATAASSGGGGKAARGGKPSRGARRARARRSRGGAADGASRRAAAEPEEAEGGRRRGRGRGGREAAEPKENKTAPLLIAIGGFVLVAFIVVAALMSDDDPKPDETATGANGTETTALTSDAPELPAGPVEPPTPTPVAPPPPAPPEPPEDSGIGGTERRDRSKDYRHYFNRSLEELFVDLPPVDGTTDEEERTLRADVAKFVDWDSARDGVDAEHRLEKAGRKTMPFLLSAFQFAYKGEKWTVDREKYAAYKIQQLARQICKADGPPSDFIARFGPGSTVPPEHYERAGRMWVAWWLGEGQHIKEFRGFDDEE